MAKGPVLFDLEAEEAPRPSVSEAPPVVDTPLQDAPQGQAMQIAARLAARKPSKLLRLFWVLGGVLVGALISLAAWRFVTDLMARYPALGLGMSVLMGAFLVVLALLALIVWIVPLVFNVTLQNFIFIAGALSVAVGFAVKDLASAMIAGFVALFEKPYRMGDWIRIGDDYGEVVTIGMRAVQLRTPDDDVVTISHDRIWSDNVLNANDGKGTLMCVATFYVLRNQPCEMVRPILQTIGRTSPYLNLDRGVIVVMENTAHCMVYKLKAYPFDMRDQFLFITDLTERGKEAVREIGYGSAFSFKYSIRPGTPGADLPNQVPEDVKSARLTRLQELLATQQTEFNQSLIGKTLPVLVENVSAKNDGTVFGRAPYLQGTHFAAGPETVGQIVQVKITDAGRNSLTGELV